VNYLADSHATEGVHLRSSLLPRPDGVFENIAVFRTKAVVLSFGVGEGHTALFTPPPEYP
jgi:hypothetical protein